MQTTAPMVPPSGKDAFSTIRELAARWKTSSRNIHRFIKRGELPAHKFGRLIRISMRDILIFETQTRSSE